MKRKNGEVFATQHSVMPLFDEDGELVSWVSVIRDITEEKRSRKSSDQYRRKLRKLAAELTVVEARERRAIAAELHENLGQVLATAKMKIAPLRRLSCPIRSCRPAWLRCRGWWKTRCSRRDR